MSAEYLKLHQDYRKAVADKDPAKSKIMNDIVRLERQSANNGVVLNAIYRGDKVVVDTQEVPSKRSLQEEYCRKFDDQTTVVVDGKEQTLREFHTKRLLKR